MSRTTASKERVCPACGEGRLESRKSTKKVEHAGVEGTLPLHYAVCDVCGSEVAEAGGGPGQQARNDGVPQARGRPAHGAVNARGAACPAPYARAGRTAVRRREGGVFAVRER